MVRSLFGNSNRKLRSTFWGSPFIPVGTNETEFCVPFTSFSVPSRFQTHATQIPLPSFLDSNRNGCGNSAVNWSIAYHYAFDTPAGYFCQMVSTPCIPCREQPIFTLRINPGSLRSYRSVKVNSVCWWASDYCAVAMGFVEPATKKPEHTLPAD